MEKANPKKEKTTWNFTIKEEVTLSSSTKINETLINKTKNALMGDKGEKKSSC